jgi:hypothetical protein
VVVILRRLIISEGPVIHGGNGGGSLSFCCILLDTQIMKCDGSARLYQLRISNNGGLSQALY